jgi:hypothetical protein
MVIWRGVRAVRAPLLPRDQYRVNLASHARAILPAGTEGLALGF